MKIQLDTTEKTIKVEEAVNLGELMEVIEKVLPDWKDYKISPTVINHFASPIIIRERRYDPYYPWWQSQLSTGVLLNNQKYTLQNSPTAKNISGVYNLQIE